MLKQLTIRNLAIIDDITIDFDYGFNVMTGETGAGKSIIIDAINLVFGARASSDLIAYGKDSAYISAALYLNEEIAKKILEEFNIDVFDEFIITRVISPLKSVIKINGMIVPLYVVNQISNLLIDISSQNESQFLFNQKNHLRLLDKFIFSHEGDFLAKYRKLYQEYLNVKNQYDELMSLSISEDELEFLKYKYNELKDYNYTLEDENNIFLEYKNLNSYSQNVAAFDEIIDLFENDNYGVNSSLYKMIKQLNKLSANSKINEYYEKFNSLYLDLYDLTQDFKNSFSSSTIDLSSLDKLSNEITKINRLKRKYNVDNLLAYKNKLYEQIESATNKEIQLSKLEKKRDELYNEALKEAHNISNIRKKYSSILSLNVSKELSDLYLPDASFSINFELKDTLNQDGIDLVSFYLSTNKGVPLMPLNKVASGGEVSRIMLGLKSVFTTLSNIDIIIFDEIDTGVSGKVAFAMGQKMAKIAKNSQVLAITHLPQVAALSDNHFYIYKESNNNHTNTIVKQLDIEEKTKEVARLLSGNQMSDSFINAAKELISSK